MHRRAISSQLTASKKKNGRNEATYCYVGSSFRKYIHLGNHMQKILSAVLLASTFLYAPVALADKDDHGHGKDKYESHKSEHKHAKKHKHKHHDDDDHRFRSSDRVIIKQYIVEDYRSHCPPGLAKKHNGCLPPGQAKKLYMIGRPLPEVVVYEPVPQPLLVQLQPVPVGYQYVMVDKDVLLISEASHKVIDAITLLSAVGK
jgi:Ni/Co efflux regulator RcnB